ncbi:proton-coupled amino acid transporter-like protein pathetic [Cimex lectularius]|uniref:Amino acid transporter transmembrane domain-containing protein n=1 Tax=Cimex lectularius TaxID=79782 RepID=A0A8I6RAL5_CIMLE|nr:proton-coupled amino acid transporter-like protein pathetic [Cimex lectularius]XP_014242317.1 proton-coupled amino acid transporter-like protein pathetic [Cimex lectularius]XP_014242327.1 proton-coupled amino acid transporter-like protein pathetic [Cimex lectularius]
MTSNGTVNMTELETFLPQDGSNLKDGGKYKINIVSKEGNHLNNHDAKAAYWDPFKERKVEHPTTDCDTLTHLLKASLGTGILAMPYAFKNAGMSLAIILTVVVAIICTHCAYILVKCAHELYRRTRVTAMSFPDVGEVAFANGPAWGRRYSKLARMTIIAGLFTAYFGTCSVYTVIISENFRQVYDNYATEPINQRLCIISLLIPLILLTYIPNLKYLAPVSMVANLFMAVGLGITFYYLVVPGTLGSPWDLPQVGDWKNLPQFFSITIFAMEAIGVVMPLENNMKTPQHFIGICGVLNRGMGGVTMVYILLGFLGYLKYPDDVDASITLSLPNEEIPAQAVKILVALAVFCTYGLQYFVCLEIVWDAVKDKSKMNKTVYEYLVRTILTTTTVLLAVAVPTIGPFLGLLGAFCFSLLGLLIPAVIEIVTFWEKGVGPGRWILWKNIFVLIFGLLALVFGSYTSIEEIAMLYLKPEPVLASGLNETVATFANSTHNAIDSMLGLINATLAAVNSTLTNVTQSL